jgi:hypothetical protein
MDEITDGSGTVDSGTEISDTTDTTDTSTGDTSTDTTTTEYTTDLSDTASDLADSGVVLVDETGSEVDLASKDSEEAISSADPWWTVGTTKYAFIKTAAPALRARQPARPAMSRIHQSAALWHIWTVTT